LCHLIFLRPDAEFAAAHGFVTLRFIRFCAAPQQKSAPPPIKLFAFGIYGGGVFIFATLMYKHYKIIPH
jgi:hypothetical protein